MLRMGTLVVVTAMTLTISGCAGSGGQQQVGPEGPRARDLILYVKNDNFYDATLYARDSGGHRQRLGNVTGLSQGTFRFRWTYLDLRIEIALLSVGSTLTPMLPVDAGDELELRIEPDLHLKIPL